MSDSDQIPGDAPFEEPASLRFLRRLVTVLTATMIIGMVVIALSIAVIARKESRKSAGENPLTAPLVLQAGESVISVSLANGRLYVVLRDGTGAEWLSVRDAASGAEQQRIGIIAKP